MIEGFPDVLARARTGDPDALATIYRDQNPALERYLRGRAPEAAEDIAADTWIAVATAIARFQGDEADFRGWVFTIARNRVIDAHRRERRRLGRTPGDGATDLDTYLDADDDAGDEAPRGHGASDAAEHAALDALETEAVLGLVRRLPPDQADVIMLRVVAGLDTERVAAVLGKRPGTIRVLQHRGLRNLERLLGDRADGPGSES